MRFSLKALLIVFTVVALWLSAFVSTRFASDTRQFIMLAIMIASGAAAYYSDGARRAFWGGFAVSLVMMALRTPFTPRMNSLNRLAERLTENVYRNPMASMQEKMLTENVQATLNLTAWLVIAAAMGWLSVRVFYHFNPPKK